MFKFPATALTLAIGLIICGKTAHADEMMGMQQDGYQLASNSPVNDMDTVAASSHDEGGNASARSNVIARDDDDGDIADSTRPATVIAPVRAAPISPAHRSGTPNTVAAPAAAAHPKNPTTVRWQSLLPGVMK